jgi:hypothetical protein
VVVQALHRAAPLIHALAIEHVADLALEALGRQMVCGWVGAEGSWVMRTHCPRLPARREVARATPQHACLGPWCVDWSERLSSPARSLIPHATWPWTVVSSLRCMCSLVQSSLEARWSPARSAWCGVVALATLRRMGTVDQRRLIRRSGRVLKRNKVQEGPGEAPPP